MILIDFYKRAVDATATVHIYLQRNVIEELIRSVFEGREGRGSLHILSYITEAVLRILPSLGMVPSSLVHVFAEQLEYDHKKMPLENLHRVLDFDHS